MIAFVDVNVLVLVHHLTGDHAWAAAAERQQQRNFPRRQRYIAHWIGAARAAATAADFNDAYQRGLGLSTDESLAIAERVASRDGAL